MRMNKFKWLVFIVCILLFSCKKPVVIENKTSEIVKNLDSKIPVIFRCRDDYPEMFWVGDYMTAQDTFTNINPVSLREVMVCKNRTLRFGKWLLKDEYVAYMRPYRRRLHGYIFISKYKKSVSDYCCEALILTVSVTPLL